MVLKAQTLKSLHPKSTDTVSNVLFTVERWFLMKHIFHFVKSDFYEQTTFHNTSNLHVGEWLSVETRLDSRYTLFRFFVMLRSQGHPTPFRTLIIAYVDPRSLE